MRCGRCGKENAEDYRFCGMCGTALVAKEQAGAASSSSDAAAAAGARPGPVITGPSFLGLNTPAPEKDLRRAGPQAERVADRGGDHVADRIAHPADSGGHDALRPSASVDYLLEDDEEPRRGWGKWILVVVALALAAGFGYLHWKQGGFDWLNAGDKKPTAATALAPEAGQSGADSGGATPSAPAGGGAPVAGGGAGAGESGAGQAAPAQSSSPVTPSESGAAPSGSAQTVAPGNAIPGNAIPGNSEPANADTAKSEPQSAPQSSAAQSSATGASAPAETGSKVADADADKQSSGGDAAPRAVTRKPAATKPSAAKAAAAKPIDAVTEAQRYIYGSGVAQDCERGLKMLKPAAEQSNVKAMTSMGVLYSTGTCTPRDLPTAYRWFALALHKEPDNQALQDDLQKLWGTMTQPERQLAIKLSQ